MRQKKSGAILMFIGALLIVIAVVGFLVDRNPSALTRQYRHDYATEQFGVFCSRIWLPSGIIGIPLFLVSLIVSLIREGKDKKNNNP